MAVAAESRHSAAMESPRSPSSRITSVGPYQFVKTLGRGVFGKVKLAVHSSTREKVAVKIIEKEKLDANTLKMVRREVMIMKLLDHPNVIKLHEVLEGPDHVFIVMEYAPGGEMIDFVIAHGKLQEKLARQFFRQVVYAIDYCHSLHVIHRDLKPENLLLDADFHIKIIDFGLSNVYVPGQFLKTFCGSPTYSAPELIEQQQYQGPKIDIWSLGVVLFVMVCGYLPFDGSTFAELFGRIVKGEYVLPDHVSEDCRDLIAKMLLVNSAKRCSIDDVRVHPWVLQNGEPVPKAQIPHYIGAVELDPILLEEMSLMGFDPEAVALSVRQQQFDDNAATYYLLCARKARDLDVIEEEGFSSDSAPTSSDGSSTSSNAKRARPVKAKALARHEEQHTRKVKTWDESNLKAQQTATPPHAATGRIPAHSAVAPATVQPKTRRHISDRRHSPPASPTKLSPHGSFEADELPVPHVQLTAASPQILPVSPRKTKHPRESSKDRSKSLKRDSSSGEKNIQLQLDHGAKAHKAQRPRPTKGAIVRPQTRHTLHLAKADKKSSSGRAADGEDIVIPLARSPLRSGSTTPKSSDGSRTPERPESPGYPSAELEDDESTRAVNELVHSFQTTFKITTKPASSSIGSVAPAPRKERFPVNANTTTEQSPEIVLAKLKDVLLEKSIEFGFSSPYCLHCTWGTVAFELEICSIPNLEVNGIKFHRISGDVWEYSKLCRRILEDMNLSAE